MYYRFMDDSIAHKLTGCKKCLVQPEVKDSKCGKDGWIRIECPECGFAIEAKVAVALAKWNSLNKDKLKFKPGPLKGEKWDITDSRADIHGLSDDLSYKYGEYKPPRSWYY